MTPALQEEVKQAGWQAEPGIPFKVPVILTEPHLSVIQQLARANSGMNRPESLSDAEREANANGLDTTIKTVMRDGGLNAHTTVWMGGLIV